MRPEVSSLSFNDASLLRFFSGDRSSGRRRNFKLGRFLPVRAAGDDRRRRPEPPWFVVPPSPPESVLFSVNPWPAENPLSLRMEQMKNRLTVAAPILPKSYQEVEDPAGRAVSAIVYMIGELQRCVLAGRDDSAADEMVLDRVSRDRRDSFLWLFRRVFYSSPNLVVSLLALLANYVVFSVERNSLDGGTASSAISAAAASDIDDVEKLSEDRNTLLELQERLLFSAFDSVSLREFLNWFDIGIKEGNLDPRQHQDEETCVDRRRRVYERAIAEGEGNSLILGNYAQFLYTVAHDHDRAELYFQWAAMAEPRDPEAINRYAFFLWEGRGDISGAEQMFLEAIDIEPSNHYYSSNYAWFLWKTGALDTCYQINSPAAPDW